MIANKRIPCRRALTQVESCLHELMPAMQAEGYPISDQYSSGYRSYDLPKLASTKTVINPDGQGSRRSLFCKTGL